MGSWNYIFGNVSHRYVNNPVRAGNTWCRTSTDFGRGKSVVYGEKWSSTTTKGGKYETLAQRFLEKFAC